MSRLGIKDYQDILKIIQVANSYDNVNSFRGELLNSLSHLFQAERSMFLLGNRDYSEVDGSDYVSINIDKEIWKEFPLHRAMDPFYQYGGFRRAVISIDDLMPYPVWEKDPFYNKFCRPLGIYHKLVIHLRRDREIYGVICMCRSKDQPDFSDKQKIAGQLLATPLTAALVYVSNVSRFSHNQAGTHGDQGFSPSTGSLLFDHNLNIVEIDRKAEEYCHVLAKYHPGISAKKHDGLFIPDEILDICLNLQELTATKNHNAPQHLQRIILVKGGRYIHIETYVVWKSVDSVSSPFFLVTLSDLPEPHFSQEWTAFDLTRREVEIAKCICQGLSNRDISDLLCISENTVETHLKNLFRKTGIKNRTSLNSLMETRRI